MHNSTLPLGLLDEVESSACRIANNFDGKIRPQTRDHVGMLKYKTTTRLAQMQYALLILALGGTCVLLTGLMLHVLNAGS